MTETIIAPDPCNVAAWMSADSGCRRQRVIVDNRARAGGNIAADMVSKAPRDGYTLLITKPGPIIDYPFLTNDLRYKPLKDLAPVTLIASGANVIVVNPTSLRHRSNAGWQ